MKNCATDLYVDGAVEYGERRERDKVHDEQVGPVEVNGDVERVLAQRRRRHGVDGDVGVGHGGGDALHLEEARQVVEHGEHHDQQHVDARAAVRAEGARAQRVAHGHVPLQGHRQRQVHRARLRDQPHRVDHLQHTREIISLMRKISKQNRAFLSLLR